MIPRQRFVQRCQAFKDDELIPNVRVVTRISAVGTLRNKDRFLGPPNGGFEVGLLTRGLEERTQEPERERVVVVVAGGGATDRPIRNPSNRAQTTFVSQHSVALDKCQRSPSRAVEAVAVVQDSLPAVPPPVGAVRLLFIEQIVQAAHGPVQIRLLAEQPIPDEVAQDDVRHGPVEGMETELLRIVALAPGPVGVSVLFAHPVADLEVVHKLFPADGLEVVEAGDRPVPGQSRKATRRLDLHRHDFEVVRYNGADAFSGAEKCCRYRVPSRRRTIRDLPFELEFRRAGLNRNVVPAFQEVPCPDGVVHFQPGRPALRLPP